MKSCGTAIGGGASDRSPSVDLSAPRRMRGDDEGTMHDDGRPRKSTGRHDGGSDLEMPTALTIGGQSVECQIDCEAANCTEKWWGRRRIRRCIRLQGSVFRRYLTSRRLSSED